MTELLKDIRKKDRKAVQLLYNRFGKKLYGFAVAKWKLEEDEAWELIYKTLYKIIDLIDRYTFENESKFSGFIFQVFINQLRNYYNEKKKKQPELVNMSGQLESSLSAPGETTGDDSSDNIYMKCLKKILEQFDDWKRVLLLMKAQDFSYEEIAAYVNKPTDQLKVYYSRAKLALTDKINECVSKDQQ